MALRRPKNWSNTNFWTEKGVHGTPSEGQIHVWHCGPNLDHWSHSDHLYKMVRFLVRIWLMVGIVNRWYSCLAVSKKFDGLSIAGAEIFALNFFLENHINFVGNKKSVFTRWNQNQQIHEASENWIKIALARDNPSKLPNNEWNPFGSQYMHFVTQKALWKPRNWSNTNPILAPTHNLTLIFLQIFKLCSLSLRIAWVEYSNSSSIPC